MDDIASFEIVKGASASSLYGSRAGNGVIVITTKNGKDVGNRLNVSVKTGVNFQGVPRCPVMNAVSDFIIFIPDMDDMDVAV